jgi:hypothetical protein
MSNNPDKQWSYGTSDDVLESDACPSRECAILCGFDNNSDAEKIFIAAHVPSKETLFNFDLPTDIEELLYNYAERCHLHEDLQERLCGDEAMKLLSVQLTPILAEAEQVFQRWLQQINVQALTFTDEEEVPRAEYERLMLEGTKGKDRARWALDLAAQAMEVDDVKRAKELIEEAQRALAFPEVVREQAEPLVVVTTTEVIVSTQPGYLLTDVAQDFGSIVEKSKP